MKLYKAALITVFGQGASSPARAALWRLAALAAATIVAAHVTAVGLGQMPLRADIPPFVLFWLATVATQAVVALVLLTTLGITKASVRDVFSRLLLVLPLRSFQRWAVLMTPHFVLTLLALLLIAEPFGLLLSSLGLVWPLIAAALLCGVVSALGMVMGLPRLPLIGQLVFTGVAFWAEYALLKIVLDSTQTSLAVTLAAITLGIIVAVLGLLLLVGVRLTAATIARNRTAATARLTFLPPAFWLVKKVLRSKTTSLNFVVVLFLSTALVVLPKQSGQGLDAALASFVAAVLAGSLASDIRGTARRLHPPEIVALRGTANFMFNQIIVALVVGAVAVAPLLFGMFAATDDAISIVYNATQLTLGIAAGVFAGSLIAPGARDIMGQFLAMLICLGALAGLQQLPILRDVSSSGLALVNMGVAVLLFLAACYVEYRRNRFIWGNIHAR